MKERKLTVNLAWANVFSVIVLLAAAVPAVFLWNVLWGPVDIFSKESGADIASSVTGDIIKWAVILIVFLGGLVVHELIHGMTWAHYTTNGWKSISFGVIWKMLTPYCHCDEPLLVRSYIIGGLMPLIVMGILPWVIGLCIGSLWTTLFGVVFICGASGDILIVWKLRKEKPTSKVLDHPTEAGCIIYEE